MNRALVGEVLEFVDGRWRIVHLGESVAVRDRRRYATDRPPMFPPKNDPAGPFRVHVVPGLPTDRLYLVDGDKQVTGVLTFGPDPGR